MPHWKSIGPISLQGTPGLSANQVPKDLPSKRLRVINAPAGSSHGCPAFISPQDLLDLCGGVADAIPWGLQMASGSDCVVAVRPNPSIADGCIVMDAVQQHNMLVLAGDLHTFKTFLPPEGEPFELVELDAEVKLLRGGVHEQAALQHACSGGRSGACDAPCGTLQVDAERLTSLLARQYFRRVLAVNEALVMALDGVEVIVRITSTDTLGPEERHDAVGYHCFRGALVATTAIYLTPHTKALPAGPLVRLAPSEGKPGPAASGSCSLSAQLRSTLVLTEGAEGDAGSGSAQNLASQHSPAVEEAPAAAAPAALAAPPSSMAARVAPLARTGGAVVAAAGVSAGSAAGPPLLTERTGCMHVCSDALEQRSDRAASGGSTSTSTAAPPALHMVNVRGRAAWPAPTATVNVYTNDGEWFPVKKRVLRPCISLTKLVRDDGPDCPSVNLDIDTATFDRVLLFLEAEHLCRPHPQWSLHLVETLAAAAEVLGARSLREYCQQRLGRLTSGLRLYSFDEVKAANASGLVWLILDGMVLDVTRWLPEHPGGSRIIPAQSLNMDCARFFEIYHSSRESFLYLKDFYIGELLPQERATVPRCSVDPGSQQAARGAEVSEQLGEEFVQQLRQYTTFRMDVSQVATKPPVHEEEVKVYKSF